MNLLKKWCDRTWLYLVYFLGVVMACTLIWHWASWEMSQRLICILAILVPAHVFEENSFPAGFYYMNNVGFGSEEPMTYPQNECTNMVTNLGAEIVMIIMTIVAPRIPVVVVTLTFLFGLGETFNHTRSGIMMLRLYRDKGKKTAYGPGTVTSWCMLIPLSAAALHWLVTNPVTVVQIILGVVVLMCVMVGLILLPLTISRRVKSQRFAFDDKGYFEKFEREA